MLIVCTSWYHAIVILSVALTHPHPVFIKELHISKSYAHLLPHYSTIQHMSRTKQSNTKNTFNILHVYGKHHHLLASPLFSSYQQLSLKSTGANIQHFGLSVSRSLRPSELPAPGFGSSLSPAPFSILVCLCLCSWVELITGSRLWLNTPAAIAHLFQISSAGQCWAGLFETVNRAVSHGLGTV